MYRALGMYSLLFRGTPPRLHPLPARNGAPVTRYHRSGAPQSTAEHGPWGAPFPKGHWPRHPVLVASPPTDMLRRLSSLGFPGRAAQSCAPQPGRSTTERWRGVTPPLSHEDHFPQGPSRISLCPRASSMSFVYSTSCLSTSSCSTMPRFHYAVSLPCVPPLNRVIRCNSSRCVRTSMWSHRAGV